MKLLTIDEAHDFTRLAKQTLYQLSSRGKIPHIKIGSRLLFDEAELDAWIEACRIPVSGE